MVCLGKQLQALRKERKISVQDCADLANMSEGYLKRIESGAQLPSAWALGYITTALDVPREQRRELLIDWMGEHGIEW